MTLIEPTLTLMAIISVVASVVTAIKVGTSASLSWWLVPAAAVGVPIASIAGLVALALVAWLIGEVAQKLRGERA